MEHFFRGIEDGIPLSIFSNIHIMLFIVYIIGIYLVYKFRNNFKSNKAIKIAAIVLLIDQVILYLWQAFSGYFNFELSLPLYHCRLAVIMLIFGILKDNRKLKVIGIYWGMIGSIIGMIMIDLYLFKFPHYTNFQFFLVHMMMGWIVVYLLFVEKIKISKEDNKFVLKISSFLNIGLFFFNVFFRRDYPKINYGYMLRMPDMVGEILNPYLHAILMIFVFNIALFFVYYFIKMIRRKFN